MVGTSRGGRGFIEVFARIALILAIALGVAAPASAQIPLIIPIPGKKAPKEVGPPKDATPLEKEIWPYPAPDPQTWWNDKRPKPPEEADPLGGRRVRKGERLPAPDNGVDTATYRLWGLMPLQWQLVRGDEAILEVWTRPANSVRQTVTRVTLRSDGEAFVQGRAGLACCEAVIGRRMGFDAELPAGSAERFRSLLASPLWRAPRDVVVMEQGAAEGLCVVGSAYDLTLTVPGRSITVHRACDPAAIGQAADVLEAVIGAALGHDPRFDVVFKGGANFEAERQAFADLTGSGGALKPSPQRSRPPGAEPAPGPEPAP
jgi:hypothetical protein